MNESTDELTGPALDAAIAREVMGWTLSHDYGGPCWRLPDGSRIACDFWRPSTDHNDLHRVIEWMRERGWYIEISIWPPIYAAQNFQASVMKGATHYADELASTINTAVLRACLAAVRSESNG